VQIHHPPLCAVKSPVYINTFGQTGTPDQQPYCFEVNGGELFAFAGLWDRWKDPRGNWVKTCSILTTTPNTVTSPVHDRMPVILDPDSYDLWLDPGMNNVTAATDLLKPYNARLMRCYPVSTRINHVGNDDPECAALVELGEKNRLFSEGFHDA
jgi:putative SOS response-associated peptidase YedK